MFAQKPVLAEVMLLIAFGNLIIFIAKGGYFCAIRSGHGHEKKFQQISRNFHM